MLKQLFKQDEKYRVFQTLSHKIHKSQPLMKEEIKVKLHFMCFSSSVWTTLSVVQTMAGPIYPALNSWCHIKDQD